ncbi:MAG: hypothetical protein R3A44_25820 [Caldilineaceae bacterium]
MKNTHTNRLLKLLVSFLVFLLNPLAYVVYLIQSGLATGIRWHLISLLLGVWWVFFIYHSDILETVNKLTNSSGFMVFVIVTAPFGTVVGVIMSVMNEVIDVLVRDTSEEAKLDRTIAKEQEKRAQKQEEIQNGISGIMPKAEGYVYLGAVLDDTFSPYIPKSIGIEKTVINGLTWLKIRADDLDKSMIIIGQPGSGKTTDATFIVQQLLSNTGQKVIVVDGKGDPLWAKELVTLAYKIRGLKSPILKMGYGDEGAAYNGFTGRNKFIRSRLAKMLKLGDVENRGQMYYATADELLLSYICGTASRRITVPPPLDFDDLLDRANYQWLVDTYSKDDRIKDKLENLHERGSIYSFNDTLDGLTQSFGDVIHRDGFSIEDVEFAVFSIKTTVEGDGATQFLDFFIDHLKQFIGSMEEDQKKDTVIVIDEFPAFRNESIGDVLSIGRSAGVGCIIMAQDAGAMGISPEAQRKIMGHPHFKILLKSDFPEEMIGLGGTVSKYEKAMQLLEGERTEVETYREQHQFLIPPNRVREQTKGLGFLMSSGTAIQFQGGFVGKIQTSPDAIETRYDIDEIIKRTIKVTEAQPEDRPAPSSKPQSTSDPKPKRAKPAKQEQRKRKVSSKYQDAL